MTGPRGPTRDGAPPANQVVWLDEGAGSTRLIPRQGWGPRGQRVVGVAPRGPWTTSSLLATMTTRGMGTSVIVPGPIDRRVVDQFIKELLLLLPPSLVPGQIVVLDDPRVRRSARAEAALLAAGYVRWLLPRYSPDRTLIAQTFSKLNGRRRGRRRPRGRTAPGRPGRPGRGRP